MVATYDPFLDDPFRSPVYTPPAPIPIWRRLGYESEDEYLNALRRKQSRDETLDILAESRGLGLKTLRPPAPRPSRAQLTATALSDPLTEALTASRYLLHPEEAAEARLPFLPASLAQKLVENQGRGRSQLGLFSKLGPAIKETPIIGKPIRKAFGAAGEAVGSVLDVLSSVPDVRLPGVGTLPRNRLEPGEGARKGRTVGEAISPSTPLGMALTAIPAAGVGFKALRAGLPLSAAARRAALTGVETLLPSPRLNRPLVEEVAKVAALKNTALLNAAQEQALDRAVRRWQLIDQATAKPVTKAAPLAEDVAKVKALQAGQAAGEAVPSRPPAAAAISAGQSILRVSKKA